MNDTKFFYRENDNNIDLKYFQKSDFLAKSNCKMERSEYHNRWVEVCYGNTFNLNAPVIIVSSALFIITLIVLDRNKRNRSNAETTLEKESEKFNNFDPESYIEKLKETKFPDASIGESFVKGSYVILKDLNGKTIAEIKLSELKKSAQYTKNEDETKLSELNKSAQYTKNEDETLILNDEISSDEKTSYPKFWEFWRRDYWQSDSMLSDYWEEKDED